MLNFISSSFYIILIAYLVVKTIDKIIVFFRTRIAKDTHEKQFRWLSKDTKTIQEKYFIVNRLTKSITVSLVFFGIFYFYLFIEVVENHKITPPETMFSLEVCDENNYLTYELRDSSSSLVIPVEKILILEYIGFLGCIILFLFASFLYGVRNQIKKWLLELIIFTDRHKKWSVQYKGFTASRSESTGGLILIAGCSIFLLFVLIVDHIYNPKELSNGFCVLLSLVILLVMLCIYFIFRNSSIIEYSSYQRKKSAINKRNDYVK